MLKFHHHYITSWFHLSDTPEHLKVEFLLWRRISHLWINPWAWTGSPQGRNVPENRPEIQLSHFHRLSRYWDLIRKHLCCCIWICCCSQQDDKVQTHGKFRKDHGPRDASGSQAQVNLRELWKLTLLLPPLPAQRRVFWTCTRITLCIFWKPCKIFLPWKPPRQLWPVPPFLCRQALPPHPPAGPGTLACVSFIISQIVTGSLYVMSALCMWEFCLVCPLTSLPRTESDALLALNKYFCMNQWINIFQLIHPVSLTFVAEQTWNMCIIWCICIHMSLQSCANEKSLDSTYFLFIWRPWIYSCCFLNEF